MVTYKKEPSRRDILKSRGADLYSQDLHRDPGRAVQEPAVELTVPVISHDLLADEKRTDSPYQKVQDHNAEYGPKQSEQYIL